MATKTLAIAPELRIPAVEAETSTFAVYGGKGMGKTNLAAVLAEELHDSGRRFAMIDPVGVSWGLRFAADGKGNGIPIVILGGLHGDLPIEPTGGAVVADFVADEREHVLIDISRRADGRMWGSGEKIRFVADFASRLYERQGEQRRPLMLLIDEAGRFVPQNMPKGAIDIAKCVGAIEQLVELGRNVGIGVALITQRSARMAKSVSELADCMIAFRTVGPNSIGAILDWFGDHVEKSRWNDLVEILRKLKPGKALVVSPGWLEFEGVASIRLRRTFDSSKTPTGTERKMTGRGVKPANLEAFRTRMAETVAKAEASDPSKLRARLEAAERNLAQSRENVQALNRRATVEAIAKSAKGRTLKAKPLITEAQIGRLEKLIERGKAFSDDAVRELIASADLVSDRIKMDNDRITFLLGEFVKSARAAAAPTPDYEPRAIASGPEPYLTREIVPNASGDPLRDFPSKPLADPTQSKIVTADGQPKKHIRALLTVLAQHRKAFTRKQWHTLAGYQPSGDTSVGIAELIARRFVMEGERGFSITAEGLAFLGPYETLPTGAALRAYLIAKGSKVERALLGKLFDFYPTALTRQALHQSAGYKPSGDTSVAIAKFLTLGWAVDAGGGLIMANGDLFV